MRQVVVRGLLMLTWTLFLCIPSLAAQRSSKQEDVPSPPRYRLRFSLSTLEGTRRQTRHFNLLLQEGETGRLRALTRVPVPAGTSKSGVLEAGLKCDAKYKEKNGLLFVDIEIVYSAVSTAQSASGGRPLLHEWQFSIETIIAPGAPTLLGSVEPSAESRGYELEVAAEPAK